MSAGSRWRESQTVRETAIRAALHRGDVRRAAEVLVEGFQDELYAYCVRLVGVLDAARIYHRLMLSVVTALAQQRDEPLLRAWLYRQARGLVIEHHSAHPKIFSHALVEGYAPVFGPQHAEQGRSGDEEVAQALNQLSPAAHEVLQLALWHGLRLEEIAAMTGRPTADVRTLAAEALSHLNLHVHRRNGAPS